LAFRSYYKIPRTNADTENCVAHNGSLVPVPGRDIMVQAWYQGGMSIWDFTDSADPYEIAYFDRGPIDEEALVLGGYWSTYWHNGYIYGAEIARGFDVLELTPTDDLSQAEIDIITSYAQEGDNNAQLQRRFGEAPEPEPEPGVACVDVEGEDFPDVPDGGPHGGNVGCIAGLGIAQGFPDGTFRPENSVTRDQMTSFIARMLQVAGVDLPEDAEDAFDDDDGGAHEAATNALAAAGIVEGRADGTFDPRGEVTRGQMASFLIRGLEYALDTELAPAGDNPFGDTEGSPHTDNITVANELGIALGRTETAFVPNDDVRRDQMGSFIARTLDVMVEEGFELTPIG
jgi:hypothetical protein